MRSFAASSDLEYLLFYALEFSDSREFWAAYTRCQSAFWAAYTRCWGRGGCEDRHVFFFWDTRYHGTGTASKIFFSIMDNNLARGALTRV